MVDYYHQKEIHLPRPVTGLAIMNALREIAVDTELQYRTKMVDLNSRELTIGLSSLRPYEHVVILTGEDNDKAELHPRANYSRIAIGSYSWESLVFAVGYDQDDVDKAVNRIAADLEAKLSS